MAFESRPGFHFSTAGDHRIAGSLNAVRTQLTNRSFRLRILLAAEHLEFVVFVRENPKLVGIFDRWMLHIADVSIGHLCN